MRKIVMCLVGALSLAGCATTSPTNDQTSQIAEAVERYTAQFCNFQPTGSVLLQLIAAYWQPGQPILTIADSIGNAICTSPITASTRRGGRRSIAHVVTAPNGKVFVVTDRRSVGR